MGVRIFLFLIDAFGSSDGSRRTYESAEMAANAFGSDKPWAAGFVIEYYGLMTTVIARHLTASASNAQFRVKLGIDDGLAVQVIGVQEFWYLFAYKLAELRDAALNHVSLESENEVVGNAIAILHDGSTHLHVAAPQLDKLQGITPRLDTADAAQFNLFWHLSQFQDMP